MRPLQTSRSTYNSMHQKSSLSQSWKNWYTKSSALSTPLTKSFTSKALGLQRHTLQRKSLKFSKMTTTAIWSNSFKKIARTSSNSNTTQETQTSNTSSTQAQQAPDAEQVQPTDNPLVLCEQHRSVATGGHGHDWARRNCPVRPCLSHILKEYARCES